MPINTASEIKTRFRFHNYGFNKYGPYSKDIAPQERPDFYPDIEPFPAYNSYTTSVRELEDYLSSIEERTKDLMSPIYNDISLKYTPSNGIPTYDDLYPLKWNLYSNYLYNTLLSFNPCFKLFYKIKKYTGSENKYEYYHRLREHTSNKLSDIINKSGFGIVDNASLGHDSNQKGKAYIKDAKGRFIYLKVGRAIKKLFPNLPTSLVTHMVESMKDYYDQNNFELYVHEGYDAYSFKYAYMQNYANETNPSISLGYASLTSSCLRGQVYDDHLDINEDNVKPARMLQEVIESHVHPAEAYASGDFSIVYVTDKPDPFDKSAKIHARVNVCHLQIDKDKLDLDLFKDCDDYVSISKIYISSESAKSFIVNYLTEKYQYDDNTGHFYNHNPYLTMNNVYAKDVRFCYLDSVIERSIKNNLDKAIIRIPRIRAISMRGEDFTTHPSDIDTISNSAFILIAPYLDRDNRYTSVQLFISDDDLNIVNPTEDNHKQLYIYMMHDMKPFVDFDEMKFNVTGRFNQYNGTNMMVSVPIMVTCTLTSNVLPRTSCERYTVFQDGELILKNEYVDVNHLNELSYHSKCVTFGNFVWISSNGMGSHPKIRVIDVNGIYIDSNNNIRLSSNRTKYVIEVFAEAAFTKLNDGKYIMSSSLTEDQLGIMIDTYNRLQNEGQ